MNEPMMVKVDAPGFHVQVLMSADRLNTLLEFLAVQMAAASKEMSKDKICKENKDHE
jgi:hypothetical protein